MFSAIALIGFARASGRRAHTNNYCSHSIYLNYNNLPAMLVDKKWLYGV